MVISGTASMAILAIIAACVIVMAVCVLLDRRPVDEHCGLFVLKHISTSRLCTACLVITFVLSIIWALFFPMNWESQLWNFILRAPAFFLVMGWNCVVVCFNRRYNFNHQMVDRKEIALSPSTLTCHGGFVFLAAQFFNYAV